MFLVPFHQCPVIHICFFFEGNATVIKDGHRKDAAQLWSHVARTHRVNFGWLEPISLDPAISVRYAKTEEQIAETQRFVHFQQGLC